MFAKKLLLLMLVVTLLLPLPGQKLTVKIGSIAPDRSPWGKTLLQLGREWAKISNGQVVIKVYPGGIAGGEEDSIRKVRVGTLGGVGLTNRGLTHIYPDVFVLGVPFMLNSEQEFNHIFESMKPTFEKGIEAKGFKVIIWFFSGWVNFFSKEKIVYPPDLKRQKLALQSSSAQLEQAWKKSGFQVIPTGMNDLMMSLQSGMTGATYLPPLIAATGQIFNLVPHMSDLKVAPLLGGLLISNRIWNRVPEQYRSEMTAAARRLSDELYLETIQLEKDTITEMVRYGLIFNRAPADALPLWQKERDKGMVSLIGRAFSKEVYDEVVKYLSAFRKK